MKIIVSRGPDGSPRAPTFSARRYGTLESLGGLADPKSSEVESNLAEYDGFARFPDLEVHKTKTRSFHMRARYELM